MPICRLKKFKISPNFYLKRANINKFLQFPAGKPIPEELSKEEEIIMAIKEMQRANADERTRTIIKLILHWELGKKMHTAFGLANIDRMPLLIEARYILSKSESKIAFSLVRYRTNWNFRK